ncbi:MAG: hypothetical protein J7L88_02190 [Thermoplasmata archaeon]|nr:hypothetical protein [Thermoplasmata archaeon]
MADEENGKRKLLPLLLIGAVLLASFGIIGLLLQGGERGPESGVPKESLYDEVFYDAKGEAEERFEESESVAFQAERYAPEERPPPIGGAPSLPAPEKVSPPEGESTRSTDDLLSEEGYLGPSDVPPKPDVEAEEAMGLLGDKKVVLQNTEGWLEEEKVPEEVPEPEMSEKPVIPVKEEGVSVEAEGKLESDIKTDISETSRELSEKLQDKTPETMEAGLTESDFEKYTWNVTKKTTIDSDKDGNPEWVHEIKVSYGQKNFTAINGTLYYVMGVEKKMEDKNSDGVPNYEEVALLIYANFTVNGVKVAEGISYTSIIKNDTDSDGKIDFISVKHLSFGYWYTIFQTRKSFATAGILNMTDTDGDGVMDRKEAQAFFFFRHEAGRNMVPIKEAVILIKASDDGAKKDMALVAFQRINNTAGVTLRERAFVLKVTEGGGEKNVVIVAAENNTLRKRVFFVVFNGTVKNTTQGNVIEISAFAVENRTRIGGVVVQHAVAVNITKERSGNTVRLKVEAAGAKKVLGGRNPEEDFILLSVKRTLKSGVITEENSTVIVGRKLLSPEINVTIGVAQKLYTDADGDGNPEYQKRFLAVGRGVDRDGDGVNETEGYWLWSEELWDNNSDGNPELNHTIFLMGWKYDSNSDGYPEKEVALVINITSYDNNSNGNVELLTEGRIGALKEDHDSDGVLDHEKYHVYYRRVTDVNDDGTQIEEETWENTYENGS